MTKETIQRTERGRFAPGATGNPAGGRVAPRSSRALESLLQKHSVDLIERAIALAQTNDEVLAGLLNLSAAIRIDEAVARFDKAAQSFGIAQLSMAQTLPGAH